MAEAAPPEEKEIIIVRRRASLDGEGHHGGVWKIAFADFMTAMMAFFLVLWLVNSTNKETKASIARYFNPITLSDIAPRRGLQDAQEGGTGGSSAENAKADKKAANEDSKGPIPNTTKKPTTPSEAALFRDPYGVLAEIAGGPAAGAQAPSPDSTGKARGEEGLTGGDAYRDPFAPATRAALPSAFDPIRAIFPPSTPPAPAGKREGGSPPDPAAALQPASALSGAKGSAKVEDGKSGPSLTAAQAAADAADAPKLGAELAQALKDLSAGAQPGPKIDVLSTPEGLLISVSDEVDFGMFASGSAEPDRKVVRLMEKVALALKARPGTVLVRGHTDARPFRSPNYDNWRLSSARAHMAHYMLVRGGLDEKRIERVEGYADRRPKLTANPEAAQNRRIEILLRRDKA